MIASGELLYSRIFDSIMSEYYYFYQFTVADYTDLMEAQLTIEHSLLVNTNGQLVVTLNRDFTFGELTALTDQIADSHIV